jgi:NAD+ kinase
MNDARTNASTIGIVDGDRVDALADSVESQGGTTIVASPTDLASAAVDVVLAPTDAAVCACVRARVSAPLLAVDGGPALRGVARGNVDAAIANLLDGGFDTVQRRTLAVETDGVDTVDADRTRALADVTVVTSEPARISEYAIHTGSERVGDVRADGIVLATPVGSQGYARAAGSHVLAPQTGVVAVVPIAPFATDTREWVLPEASVTISVERDEGDVSLRVDDAQWTTLSHTDRVTVTPDDPVTLAVTPESVGAWPTALEKH